MYFEEAIVKTYYRNYKNKKVPYNQLHLGKAEDSEFNKNPEEPDKVAVIKILDFEDLVNNNGLTKLNELEAKYNELQEENIKLKEQVEELNSTAKSLASDVNELTKEKLQLQEDLLTAEGKTKEIIELQKEHKTEIADKDSEIKELNYKLNNEKDYSKALLLVRSDFLKQNAFKRLFKVEPESSKAIGNMLKELPENEVEVEPKPSEETESTASSKE